MYTGYSIRDDRIFKEEEETQFCLSGKFICFFPDQPTGCCLVQSLSEGVQHIYGPNGYTKFYVDDGFIYGPNTLVPWFSHCEEPQAADTGPLPL